ncbi:YlzJ-like family protein [Paenibacillus farraposensis]|jgi:hypothetical protein|uniref:YlzJ-like family protein n=1 Tax=Paenibacillus farraposensis TaxID=2807095 RepID=A0ABW4D5P5_9BACL|nr:YlzJ-like family protein [Paenibacillus farraposensis]MCC3381290.1 YlzJ-like family protein [Paenibacillus farraposensis]
MTLYTVMPMEMVWEGMWKEPEALAEVRVDGLLMQVQPLESRRGIIVRLLECPLEAYLNPRYEPGQVIEWS